jgi:hypothetical protein
MKLTVVSRNVEPTNHNFGFGTEKSKHEKPQVIFEVEGSQGDLMSF